MIIDGRNIADNMLSVLKETIQREAITPKLFVFVCAPNFETKKYLALKEKRAQEVGIVVQIIELTPESVTEDFIGRIHASAQDSDGIIVQLPLPHTIDRDRVTAAIPQTHDVDALNPQTTSILSPVVGAIAEILRTHGVIPRGKRVTIIGKGSLVGLPAQRWFEGMGADVRMVTKDTEDVKEHTKDADIVVCGAGVPGLLKPDMVKDGVVILDAGTSEDGGELRGDADPQCAEKASLFTPVPGGIGPITIAMLLSNVVDCALKKRPVV
jgi:methylenetetrahydrofolate dehydrogenase (NADP+) / methenyltetrahydrofolate cyclohydrolase